MEGRPVRRLRPVPVLLTRPARPTGPDRPVPGELELPDPDDRHVLAAAIEAAAEAIVTMNLADFPQASLNQFGIEAIHPDKFVFVLLEEEPDQVLRAVCQQRAAYRDPVLSVEELVAALEKCGLAETGRALRARYFDRL